VPLGGLVALVCVLASPAAAFAHRDPTARERAQITRAALAANGSPTQTVKVTDLVISTQAPWARANVSLYLKSAPKAPEQVSEELFYRSRGRWHDRSGTSRREPPDAVVSDLDLSGPGGTNRTRGLIILGVAFALLLAAGMVYRIRNPSPVRTRTTAGGGGGGGGARAKPPRQYETHRNSCIGCGGEKVTRCNACNGGGGGWTPNPNNPDTLIYQPCTGCGDRREWTCEVCKGTGLQSW